MNVYFYYINIIENKIVYNKMGCTVQKDSVKEEKQIETVEDPIIRDEQKVINK